MTTQLSAGVARIDITPPIGIAHAGWGAQTHQRAVGVDLPLWATALALSDGDQRVVIVDIDIGYLWPEQANAAMEAVTNLTGLPTSHVRLSYTHTHSGPSTRGTWFTEGTEMLESYNNSLTHRIAGVAWSALQNLQPARIAAGSGACNIAVNRRFQRPEDGEVVVGHNWDGPVDHQVNVVRIDTLEGQPLAAIVDYACHPITVGPDNDLITPDFPGVTKRVVEQSTGATCLYLQGAAGNIGPVRGGARNGINEYKRLGAMLGHEVSRVWWELELPPRPQKYTGTLESGAPLAIYHDEPVAEADATLRVGTRTMSLPVRELPPPDKLDAELKHHTERLNQLRAGGGSDDDIRRETMRCKRTKMRADLSRRLQGKTHLYFDAQAFIIGNDIALIDIPGEPFVEIGLGVKQNSPFKHTLFSGYSNTDWAYIPMPDAYPLGGYEIEITYFSPEAGPKIIDECTGLLNSLVDEK